MYVNPYFGNLVGEDNWSVRLILQTNFFVCFISSSQIAFKLISKYYILPYCIDIDVNLPYWFSLLSRTMCGNLRTMNNQIPCILMQTLLWSMCTALMAGLSWGLFKRNFSGFWKNDENCHQKSMSPEFIAIEVFSRLYSDQPITKSDASQLEGPCFKPCWKLYSHQAGTV